jgi:hypothetical protein
MQLTRRLARDLTRGLARLAHSQLATALAIRLAIWVLHAAGLATAFADVFADLASQLTKAFTLALARLTFRLAHKFAQQLAVDLTNGFARSATGVLCLCQFRNERHGQRSELEERPAGMLSALGWRLPLVVVRIDVRFFKRIAHCCVLAASNLPFPTSARPEALEAPL